MKKFRDTKPGKEIDETVKNAELSENELQNTAGGCGSDDSDCYETHMYCDNCQMNFTWKGRYVNGVKYKCKLCGAEALKGISEQKVK